MGEDASLTKQAFNRRSFLRNSMVAGAAATVGAGLLEAVPSARAQEGLRGITRGDAAILRFLAAAELIESDLWLQYAELGGVQDNEVFAIASRQIPGYPDGATGGIPTYTQDLTQLDMDMPQYIHDNTEDELSHETFINAYLVSKGAQPVSLDRFRTLPSSKATGAKQVGRLTNLMQLTVDTSWWTRYRSRTGNPDLGDTFPNAVPTLATGQHPAIPRSDDDLKDANFLQAIANTAGFHFAFIEQGGSSLYPQLAQRVSSVEVLRILLSIGGTEITHFQTWHDKAGNAPNISATDPKTGVMVSFPKLSASTDEDLQANLIMPEPTAFLSRDFPVCSIIRPTATKGAAMGAIRSFVDDGLFIGQSAEFFAFVRELAEEADAARRGGN
ncbi:MAG: hypothetical protein JO159_04160 [Acidobacteria bacterium]|nr:hypothetical protein [Acidobacteriota bacterium]MBV9622518.1 hypothetical protein [Acidobacteriota bacterium]